MTKAMLPGVHLSLPFECTTLLPAYVKMSTVMMGHLIIRYS